MATVLALLKSILPSLGSAAARAGRWTWANRRATLPVLLPALALLVLLGWLLWREHQRAEAAESRATRATEAVELERQGFTLAIETSQKEMAARLELLQRRLATAGINSTPTIYVEGSTGPRTAGGDGLASAPLAAQAPALGPPPPGAGCLLADGDQGEIRASGGAVRTEAGNYVIEGEASAWRVTSNSPQTRLFGGPLKLKVSIPSSGPLATKHGAGLGGAMSVADRFRVGLAFAPPSFDALWLRWDSSLSIQCDPRTLGSVCRDGHGGSTAMLTVQIIGRRR